MIPRLQQTAQPVFKIVARLRCAAGIDDFLQLASHFANGVAKLGVVGSQKRGIVFGGCLFHRCHRGEVQHAPGTPQSEIRQGRVAAFDKIINVPQFVNDLVRVVQKLFFSLTGIRGEQNGGQTPDAEQCVRDARAVERVDITSGVRQRCPVFTGSLSGQTLQALSSLKAIVRPDHSGRRELPPQKRACL